MSQSLLERVAAGDLIAVQDCIDRYGGLIWSLVRRVGIGRADAEDAVQEVFIDLWKSAGRFDARVASEHTFVAMIARRRLIDRRRRLSARPDTAHAVPIEEVDLPIEDGSGEEIEITDEVARAAEAIQRLRPEQREVLRLSVYDGWSHQRIADHLHMPLGTVKTHVRRGLIRIRELLGGDAVASGEGEQP